MKVEKKDGCGEVFGIRRAVSLLVALTYLSCLCPAAAYAAPPAPERTSVAAAGSAVETSSLLISAEHGGAVRLGRASIVIPAGALLHDTEISITRLASVADTGESIQNSTERGGGYRFLPAGQQFQKEVLITLPYDRSLNINDAALEDIATYFYSEQERHWVRLERREVNRPESLVTSASTHFTDMINATLALPEAASPLELNINSIKNLEAADPLGGMIKMDAPQAGAFGDASFSLPLQIPAGRAGMQPQMALTYSSGGGNGIAGKGFDLRYGSTISTDTRLGLPEYDGHDVYLKDGTELVLYGEDGRDQEYTALREAAFERIVRHDVGGQDWWEVTDKAGTRRLYGRTSAGAYDGNSRAGYTAEGRYRTYTWQLTEEIDVYGNSTSYSYEEDGGFRT